MTKKNCSICKAGVLAPQLEDGLVLRQCNNCRGRLIEAASYRDWQQKNCREGVDFLATGDAEVPQSKKDSQDALACPGCSALMLKYKVGKGHEFRIDFCGACGCTWLDGGEFEALRQSGLHDELHRITSYFWQNEIKLQERRERKCELERNRLMEDFTRVDEFRSWLQSHPEKSYILSLLREA